MDLSDLQRMTVVKLREEALKHDGISGVNGMNKEKLIAAVAPALGIDIEAETRALKERLAASKGVLKKEIAKLKGERDNAAGGHDAESAAEARKQIKRRKRHLRKMIKTGATV